MLHRNKPHDKHPTTRALSASVVRAHQRLILMRKTVWLREKSQSPTEDGDEKSAATKPRRESTIPQAQKKRRQTALFRFAGQWLAPMTQGT
ncbi:hypothetical protein [Diaphorobacter aerolatus]|uniref:Uncharacterized protein n=1 Tax=Diaphorobacter aerolatus TaxID=1288495 RepID=A0A7H0GID6_9BURK|nr:hypothetical protein [Diaphorobacter aerolatus]QNP48052.1 hypothetical protein H9K75_18535 [Diaphorobacter aerolatus]